MRFRTRPTGVVTGALLLALAVGAAPAAAVISMSRGQQFFPISHQECMSRARAALQAAGYTLWSDAGNGPWGNKGDHGAAIFCEGATDGQVVVDILVATANTDDGNVPGVERVRLQELMERGSNSQTSSEDPACPANAIDLRGTGRSLTCWCSEGATTNGAVWGSGVYTDDSVICRAAVHAGVIRGGGGTVTIRALPGRESYPSTTSNGITSSSYGVWHGSYRFEEVP